MRSETRRRYICCECIIQCQKRSFLRQKTLKKSKHRRTSTGLKDIHWAPAGSGWVRPCNVENCKNVRRDFNKHVDRRTLSCAEVLCISSMYVPYPAPKNYRRRLCKHHHYVPQELIRERKHAECSGNLSFFRAVMYPE